MVSQLTSPNRAVQMDIAKIRIVSAHIVES